MACMSTAIIRDNDTREGKITAIVIFNGDAERLENAISKTHCTVDYNSFDLKENIELELGDDLIEYIEPIYDGDYEFWW